MGHPLVDAPDAPAYLNPEAAARLEIDEMLEAAGWAVQDYQATALGLARGVAARELPMASGHGTADSLLFITASRSAWSRRKGLVSL